jgi:hypothetical protein
MLILFIIFMPQGIVGLIEGVSGRLLRCWRGAAPVPATRLWLRASGSAMRLFFIATPRRGR